MGVRLDGPANRSLTTQDMAVVRITHEAFVVAVDTMREQAQLEVARTLGVSVERVKAMWWASGCT